MSPYLENLLSQASALAQDSLIKDNVDSFTRLIDSIFDNGDSDAIPPLLLMLSDTSPVDEALYAVVHAAEGFGLNVYINQLITHLADPYAKAPEWTCVLLVRILNSEAGTKELLKQLHTNLTIDRKLFEQVGRDLIRRFPNIEAAARVKNVININ